MSETICINCPLPPKPFAKPEWWGEGKEWDERWNNRLKVLFFDPTEIYERLGNKIDHYKRTQSSGLGIAEFFPDRTDGLCACGCGRPARKRWATDMCSEWCWQVRRIICYGTAEARMFVEMYYGEKCVDCEERGCDIDHILPVKHGGGGCWLSNFVPRCPTCHKDKTNRDFKRGKYKNEK